MIRTIILTSCILILTASCRYSYITTGAKEKLTNHKIIAIIPPKVSVAGYPNMKEENLLKLYISETNNFQQELYDALAIKKSEGKLNIDILSIAKTNSILKDFTPFEIPLIDPEDLCRLLKVDAVITSEYIIVKSKSTAGAVSSVILFGQSGTTNIIEVYAEIYDSQSLDPCWIYKRIESGSLITPLTLLRQIILGNVAKEVPYGMKKIK
ncbi:MAG: hypothetical protein OEW75_09495 [Cyclobacteriaceae bacterium]|nr:hypothetical protein [Cyclobacteriaceae bacterium]